MGYDRFLKFTMFKIMTSHVDIGNEYYVTMPVVCVFNRRRIIH
jgi:hypothetical protein